jgi:protein-S-isoprenylcysteine O-methyltransferase Ste14
VRIPLPVAIGRVLFNIRNALFPVAFIVFALASRPRYPLGSARWNLALDLLGLAVAFAGQALRVAVIGLDYIQRGGKNRQIHADHLVTGGFFAHSRNPLYVGNMMIYSGLFLVLNSMAGYLLGVPFFIGAYLCITAAEEEYLARTFGAEYEAYRAKVPRFWPRWSGLGATMRGMEFDWRRVVRKEYGTTFSWLTTAIALLYWQALRNESPEVARATLWRALALWTPVVLGYLVARVMKKSGALKSA